MSDQTNERTFQDEMIEHLLGNGWLLGSSADYNRDLALYEEDLLGFVQETQPEQWKKFNGIYPNNAEAKFLERVATQLNKADPNAADSAMRTYGTLGVLRHPIKDRGTRFDLCQFKPEHDLNPETLARYRKNRLRVVPELVYSPWTKEAKEEEPQLKEMVEESGAQYGSPKKTTVAAKAKKWRIDLVLFVNGLPVATLELKSEFKQEVEKAKNQYRYDRLPIDPATKKAEPLLTFKRGALVHFAVSQYQVYMTTRRR